MTRSRLRHHRTGHWTATALPALAVVVYPAGAFAQTGAVLSPPAVNWSGWLTLAILACVFAYWFHRDRKKAQESEAQARRRIREALFRLRRELWGNHAKLKSRFDAAERIRLARNAINFAFFETYKINLSSNAYERCSEEVLGGLPIKLANLLHHTYATILDTEIKEQERLYNLEEIRRSFPDLQQVDMPADEMEDALERWQAEIAIVRRSLQTVEKYLRVKPLVPEQPAETQAPAAAPQPQEPMRSPPPLAVEPEPPQTAPQAVPQATMQQQQQSMAGRQPKLSFAAE